MSVAVKVGVSNMDLFLEKAFGIVVVWVEDDDAADFVRGSLSYRRKGIDMCRPATAYISEMK